MVDASSTPSDTEKQKEYDRTIIRVFEKLHKGNPDASTLAFTMRDIKDAIQEVNAAVNNVPDVAYTYRSGRSALPQAILDYGNWAIVGAGKGRYTFVRLKRSPYVEVPGDIEVTRILDATPQIILKYQGEDEQGMLARIRYNRLVDIFMGLTTYHLQGHYRTTVPRIGQVEVDDLYIGIDTNGQGFSLPVEAKAASPKDQLGVVQITQIVGFARNNFKDLPIRPIGIKAMADGSYVFMEFNDNTEPDDVLTKRYKRYQLYRER